MRIDVVSIFPEYLAPLGLSLPGKARESGLLDVHVHDLRDWTHDRHRTVDDTPYGGGAGMVMKPEPWGEALDAVAARRRRPSSCPPRPGRPFTQAVAAELADARAPGLRLRPLRGHRPAGDRRRGDADGGARGVDRRLRPQRRRGRRAGDHRGRGPAAAGLHGQRRSRSSEESLADGLLEYPVYTKPAGWRGHDVPDVLLSGDHARIAAWRHDQSVRRTAERRPDLAHAARAVDLGALAAEIAPGRPRRRRRAVHPAARVLGPGAAGQPGGAHPAAARVLRRRAGWLERVDDARAAQRRAARRRRARVGSRATPGTSAG